MKTDYKEIKPLGNILGGIFLLMLVGFWIYTIIRDGFSLNFDGLKELLVMIMLFLCSLLALTLHYRYDTEYFEIYFWLLFCEKIPLKSIISLQSAVWGSYWLHCKPGYCRSGYFLLMAWGSQKKMKDFAVLLQKQNPSCTVIF
jgi:hypothetical protein